MTKDEALDLALEALEELQPDDAYPYSLQSKAITAIKQARSAPVQEPVFCEYCGGNDDADFGLPTDHCTDCARPQPAAQQALVQEPVALPCCGYTDASAIKWNPFNGVVQCHNCGQTYATSAAPAQEPVAFNAGVPPLYPEMKDGETISVEYTTPPGGRQSEDCLTAAQEDIQRLSALVRAQQITIDKLEQARSAPVQEPVAVIGSGFQLLYCREDWAKGLKIGDKLYTTPPAQPAPVQEQIVALIDENQRLRAELKFNTPPAAQRQCKWPTCQSEEYQRALAEQINQELVTGAAQWQWVGLTDEEFEDIELGCRSTSSGKIEAMQKVEAKLKEKNT